MRSRLLIAFLTAALVAVLCFGGQPRAQSITQAGPSIGGHLPMYVLGPGQGFASVMDSGFASGLSAAGTQTGAGLTELLQVNTPGTPGSGPFASHNCFYGNPPNATLRGTSNPSGYYFLCFDAAPNGANGLLSFGAGGLAAPIPFDCNINGILVQNCLSGSPVITITGLVSVATNAVLRGLMPGQYAAVIRQGFTVAGDASPLVYNWVATCPGTPDNGAFVSPSTTDPGCWVASFPVEGADVREWGAVAGPSPETTDSTAAMQAALNWAAANARIVRLPPGEIYLASSLATATIKASGAVSVIGGGQDVSFVRLASGVSGMSFTRPSPTGGAGAIHVRDFTFLASGANVGTALAFHQLGDIPSPNNAYASQSSSQSDVTNIKFRGAADDATQCFATDFFVDYLSTINFIGDTFIGCGTLAGTGIVLAGGGAPLRTGTVYNVSNSYFILKQYGIVYQEFIQGVQIVQSNFVADTYGIYVPPGEHNASQLTLSSSQCGFTNYCIYDGSGVPQVTVTGNLIYSSEVNFFGLWLQAANQLTITGNAFAGVAGRETLDNLTGIFINSELVNNGGGMDPGYGGTITGNTFTFLTNPIILPAKSGQSLPEARYIYTAFNNYTGGSTAPEVANSNINNTLFNQPFASAFVTGAVNNGTGQIRLTVNSTTPFTTGNVVLIANVGGVGSAQGAILDKIVVIDGTHMDTFTAAFSGGYTSGGSVTAMP